MATALDAARFLIQLGYSAEEPEESDFLCPLRVQKLLYYVQGWSLAVRGRPMFGERIEAWKFGPVIPEIYQQFKSLGFSVIRPEDAGTPENLSPGDRAFIEAVWSEYKEFSATKLRAMTHQEAPWKDARRGLPSGARYSGIIPAESLQAFFQGEAAKRGGGLVAGFDPQESWESYEEMLNGGGRSLHDLLAEMRQ